MIGERYAERAGLAAGMAPLYRLAAWITGPAFAASHHHATAAPAGL